jgi:DNA-binding transcriptional ArsR family regulator/precorrin-6B methylase 2
MSDVFSQLSALSEPIRVRLLHLLSREELGVGELARVTQTPQPTVSRHLKALRLAGWVRSRPDGPSNLFRFADLVEPSRRLWDTVAEQAVADPEDLRRLHAIIALRGTDAADFFGRVADSWDQVRRDLYGDGFAAHALLSLLPPDQVIADLGCGTGVLLEALAPLITRVIGVDRESAMIEAAGRRTAQHDNVRLVEGDLRNLPIPSASVDGAVMALVLHLVAEPSVVLAEAARIVKPGSRVVVLDMLPHDRSAYRQSMGHVHLGFSENDLASATTAAGLTLRSYRCLPPDPDAQGPGLFIAIVG